MRGKGQDEMSNNDHGGRKRRHDRVDEEIAKRHSRSQGRKSSDDEHRYRSRSRHRDRRSREHSRHHRRRLRTTSSSRSRSRSPSPVPPAPIATSTLAQSNGFALSELSIATARDHVMRLLRADPSSADALFLVITQCDSQRPIDLARITNQTVKAEVSALCTIFKMKRTARNTETFVRSSAAAPSMVETLRSCFMREAVQAEKHNNNDINMEASAIKASSPPVATQVSRRVFGPQLAANESEGDSDGVGPLLPSQLSSEQSAAQKRLQSLRAELRQIQSAPDAAALSRDEWMTKPPTRAESLRPTSAVDTLPTNVSHFSLRTANTSVDALSSSSWTSSPNIRRLESMIAAAEADVNRLMNGTSKRTRLLTDDIPQQQITNYRAVNSSAAAAQAAADEAAKNDDRHQLSSSLLTQHQESVGRRLPSNNALSAAVGAPGIWNYEQMMSLRPQKSQRQVAQQIHSSLQQMQSNFAPEKTSTK